MSYKKILTIQDISCVGQCSLTVALPILSACGMETCILPSAILSTHTAGFSGFTFRDLTDDMPDIQRHWQKENIRFRAIYTGYLGSIKQIAYVKDILQTMGTEDCIRVVDPAMADHGRLYSSCSPALVPAMARLVSLASVATPNLTELCLLTGADYAAVVADERRQERVEAMARRLLESGCGAVVVTGVEAGDVIENCVLTAVDAAPVWVSGHRVDRHFAGTGDLFASVLCGWMLRGLDLVQAVEKTVDFVCRTTAHTAEMDTNGQDGIAFEPFLCELNREEYV
jgi:pyridoxine kinase